MSDAPQVFISFAGEDRERFVEDFAAKLRMNGVDAWVSFWEIQAGDSLIKKVFDEGIGNASTVIIVLSSYSVGKPWVREELDVAAIRRIEGIAKLIPVKIETCDVPVSLSALKRVTVSDLADTDGAVQEVLDSIFGVVRRPELGSSPKWSTQPTYEWPV